MKLSINTDVFKDMVSRSTKGASCNKIMPITSMMAIQLSDNVLTLITSDASNYLYVRRDKVEGEDFYVTVPVDKFSKLIARMTCEKITLELKLNGLEVSGNGTYMIELPDEEGELVKYPDPLSQVDDPISVGEIQATTIANIINTAKPSLAKTLEEPQYVNYYVGEKVAATDTAKMCVINTKVFDTSYLISPEMMDLLSLMTSEKISVDAKDNILIFSSPECVVYGPIMEGIEDYEIDSINALVEDTMTSCCKLSKSLLLQLLDRLSLFVNDLDEGAINLLFTKDGLMIKSKAESGSELIPYMESKGFRDFICMVDIQDLITQVKSQSSDSVEMYYGNDTVLKTVDGNVTQAICLLQEMEQGEA